MRFDEKESSIKIFIFMVFESFEHNYKKLYKNL